MNIKYCPRERQYLFFLIDLFSKDLLMLVSCGKIIIYLILLDEMSSYLSGTSFETLIPDSGKAHACTVIRRSLTTNRIVQFDYEIKSNEFRLNEFNEVPAWHCRPRR